MKEIIEMDAELVRCAGCEKKFIPKDVFIGFMDEFYCGGRCFHFHTNNKYITFEKTPTGRIKKNNGEPIEIPDYDVLHEHPMAFYKVIA